MKKPIIVEIKRNLTFKQEIEYVFSVLASFLGYPILLVEEKQQSPPHFKYGLDAENGENVIVIPHSDYSEWAKRIPFVKQCQDGIILDIDNNEKKCLFYRKDNSIYFTFDLICACFYLLSRQEESVNMQRDQWDCFSANSSFLKKNNIVESPLVNDYFSLLRDLLASSSQGRFEFEPLWKNGKKFAIALIHDVDQPFKGDIKIGVRTIGRSLIIGLRGLSQGLRLVFWDIFHKIKGLQNDPYFNFDKYMQIENKFGFKSTFSFVAQVMPGHYKYDVAYLITHPKIRQAIKRVRNAGWGVSLHASYYAAEEKNRFEEEKISLEKVINKNINGVSQHYLRIKENTLEIQSEFNILCDSSLGFNESLGFRAGVALPFFPYRLKTKTILPVLEIPLIVMDSILFNELKLNVKTATERVISLLEKIKKSNGAGSILWHLHTADDQDYPGWFLVYQNILEYLQKEGAWVTTPEEIAISWKNRWARINALGKRRGI